MKLTIWATSIMCVFKLRGSARDATKYFLAPELYICSLFKILPVKHIRHFTQLFPHRIFVVEDKCTNAEYTRIRSTKYQATNTSQNNQRRHFVTRGSNDSIASNDIWMANMVTTKNVQPRGNDTQVTTSAIFDYTLIQWGAHIQSCDHGFGSGLSF